MQCPAPKRCSPPRSLRMMQLALAGRCHATLRTSQGTGPRIMDNPNPFTTGCASAGRYAPSWALSDEAAQPGTEQWRRRPERRTPSLLGRWAASAAHPQRPAIASPHPPPTRHMHGRTRRAGLWRRDEPSRGPCRRTARLAPWRRTHRRRRPTPPLCRCAAGRSGTLRPARGTRARGVAALRLRHETLVCLPACTPSRPSSK